MARRKQSLAEPPADPFGERRKPARRAQFQLMGAQFNFEADSRPLLSLVQSAYRGLPPHEFPGGGAPRCLVRVALTAAHPAGHRKGEPPRVMPVSGAGMLCGVAETASFVALTPQHGAALVVVSQDMLGFPYHVRYEMLEFAAYVLASRVQGLVPLHAACVGLGGQGLLLLGESGSGKSTLSLHCLLGGFEFLAEDSVLVRPEGLLATGVANFLHARRDSLRFLDAAHRAALVRNSGTIRRRSGVEKLEIDLRRRPFRLAGAPLRLVGVVFVSPRQAGKGSLLAPMPQARVVQKLAASQRYAANQPGWAEFARKVRRLPAFELLRGGHPREAVEALKGLFPLPLPLPASRGSGP